MSSTSITTRNYTIDPAHTTVEFVVRHMMIAKVRGRFTYAEGTIVLPDGSNVPSAVDVSIDTASIATGEQQRDAHLRSADFFEAEKFPKITFHGAGVEGSGGTFQLAGQLTIHGVTREVILDVTFEGRGSDPWGNERIGYEATGKINRKDFGLTWNQGLETGGVLVSDEVKIELSVEGIAAK